MTDDASRGEAARAGAEPYAGARAGYSLRNIAAATSSVSSTDLWTAARNVSASACFAKAFQWSMGVGALFALHRLKQGGRWPVALQQGGLSCLGTFGIQWFLCRREEYDRKLALKAFYGSQQAVAAATSIPVQDVSAERVQSAEEEEWLAEVDALLATQAGSPSASSSAAGAALAPNGNQPRA